MFGNSKEYHDIQKLYLEKVSKPEQLDELKTGPGPNTPPKKTTSFGDAIKANQNRSATTTSTPKMSTSGAQITTNQRQSRDLASKNKDVKLNKFSRTKTYGADAKGVKLVPGSKVGQQVNRSTVQTKAEFDFGGVKKGERLGVMTRNQRRKYDLMAAQRAKKNEPKPDIKPIDANPFQGEPKTDEKKPVENKGKVIRGQGGRPLGSTTRRQGGSVKDGKKLFIDKDKAKAYTDKTGKASQVVSKDELVKRTSRAPIFQSFGKSRQLQSQGKNPQTVMSRDTKRQIADLEGNKDDKKEKTLTTQQKMRQKLRNNRNRQESYDAYDVVLEYLLTSQQAATIEEANYIMTEMDAKTIQDIVSQQLNEQN